MKFVKENLVLVISGAVVLLVLVASFVWPVPSWKADLQEEMKSRYGNVKTMQDQEKKPLELPGVATTRGVPTQDWIAQKQKVNNDILAESKKVQDTSRRLNAVNRVDDKGVPYFPIPQKIDMSTPGVSIAKHLPTSQDPSDFRFLYGQQFRMWTNLLASGQLSETEPGSTIPPAADALLAQFNEKLTLSQQNAPTGVAPAFGTVNSQATATNPQFLAYAKEAVTRRASNLRMYIEKPEQNVPGAAGGMAGAQAHDYAFQIRPWFATDDPPSNDQIFEAVVDSWIQADVVRAILETNNEAFRTGEKNVGRAAVKRLTRIMVGNNARNRYLSTNTTGGAPITGGGAARDPGLLLFTAGNAGQTAGAMGTPLLVNPANIDAVPAQATVDPNAANKINLDLSMTGRSSGADYDTVCASVVLDIDASYLNSFINHLYQKNMGYTVTLVQWRSVDPLERASNGYLYGEAPVIEVEIQFESLMFRSWTQRLMPDGIRNTYGIPAPATQSSK